MKITKEISEKKTIEGKYYQGFIDYKNGQFNNMRITKKDSLNALFINNTEHIDGLIELLKEIKKEL